VEKKPKFFCESCGSEVRQNDRLCPHCGRFFASVKCPSCGISGDARAFRNGCPRCGYAMNGTAGKSGEERPGRKPVRATDTDPLPWWIYLLAGLLLSGVLALILLKK
jgi:hypothetical protein